MARWVCLLEPSDLTAGIGTLRIGKAAMEWYQSEILRLRHVGGPAEHGTPHVHWGTLDHEFFAAAAKAA